MIYTGQFLKIAFIRTASICRVKKIQNSHSGFHSFCWDGSGAHSVSEYPYIGTSRISKPQREDMRIGHRQKRNNFKVSKQAEAEVSPVFFIFDFDELSPLSGSLVSPRAVSCSLPPRDGGFAGLL